MVTVENVHTVYCKLDNRPGALERCAKIVGDRRINIDAISAETVGSTGIVRLITPRPREVVDALHAAHLEAYESPSILVSPLNRPGELSRVCAEIAAAGINVEAVTTTADGRLCLRTSDNERASQILRKM